MLFFKQFCQWTPCINLKDVINRSVLEIEQNTFNGGKLLDVNSFINGVFHYFREFIFKDEVNHLYF